MGDTAALMKARQELQDLYLGVPDDSVDLSFKDLPSFQQNEAAERKISNMEPIHEGTNEDVKIGTAFSKSPSLALNTSPSLAFGKSPSLDFVKGLQEGRDQQHQVEDGLHREDMVQSNFRRNSKGLRMMVENSQVHHDDNVSVLSMAGLFEERGGRRRPGIPHSNICALCSIYIYFFRHRCLVCGRVYCRNCVGMGMGEMAEGRKCIECLGRRFSQRYIQRAGQTGCCWRYPSMVKQQELMWAEKGPRRSGERPYKSGVASRSQNPVMPATPSRAYASRSRGPVIPGAPTRSHYLGNSSASFVASSTFSPNPHAFPL